MSSTFSLEERIDNLERTRRVVLSVPATSVAATNTLTEKITVPYATIVIEEVAVLITAIADAGLFKVSINGDEIFDEVVEEDCVPTSFIHSTDLVARHDGADVRYITPVDPAPVITVSSVNTISFAFTNSSTDTARTVSATVVAKCQ